jgi:hypothetical protein
MPWRWCLAVAVLFAAACSAPTDPISVHDNIVTIENRSPREWRNVVVTVNDHFRGGAQSLAARGRLTAPLSQFQTGYGQRYQVDRQPVFRIEVTATDANGDAVKLEWGRKNH